MTIRKHRERGAPGSRDGGGIRGRPGLDPGAAPVLILLILVFIGGTVIPRPEETSGDLRSIHEQYFRIRKLQAQKKFGEAISQSRKLIEREPDFQDIYPHFARMSKAAGQADASIAFLRRLIEAQPGQTSFYYGLGLCLRIQERFEASIEAYKAAIDLQAPSILIYYELVAPFKGDFSELLRYFEDRIRGHPENPFLYYGMGIIHEYKLGKLETALGYYDQAARIARDGGRTSQAAQMMNHIGVYHWNRGNYAKALEHYRQAAATAREIENKADLARYHFNCGLASCNLGDFRQGLNDYQEALRIDRDIGLMDHEAQTLRNIGHVHFQLSEYALALDFFNRALLIVREIGDQAAEGRYLADLASVSWAKGDYPRALEYGEAGLRLARANRDSYGEITALSFVGKVHWTTGHFSKALEYYSQALERSRNAGDRTNEASSYNDIGLIYRETGEYAKALNNFERGLKIFRETGGKVGEGMCLNNIALVHMALEDYPKALEHLESALRNARETGNRYSESNRLGLIGAARSRLGDDSQALENFEDALKIARAIGSREREAFVLRDRGELLHKMSRLAEAEDSFGKALAIALEIGQPTAVWRAYSGLARVLEQSGRFLEASANYKKSIEVIEDLRARFPSEEQRAGYLKDKIGVYESLINVLFALHRSRPEEGFDRESFYFAEKAKARAFLDSLDEARISLAAGLPPRVRDEEIRIAREISALQAELAKPSLSGERRVEVFKRLDEAEEAYRAIIRRLRLSHPLYAQWAYPEPLRLVDVQEKVVDEDTILLEYFVGKESAFLFHVAPRDFSVHRLSGGQELQERASSYSQLLSTKTGRDFAAAAAGKRMFEELIGPVADKIGRASRLIVVPDGRLHYLPFEAIIRGEVSASGKNGIPQAQDAEIKSPGRFLVEDFAVSYAPSASSLSNLMDRKRGAGAKKLWLAFADPVYAFERAAVGSGPAAQISRNLDPWEGFEYSPLAYSGEEVKEVARLIRRGQREIYTREAAKEDRLKALPLKDFRILHFATHGLLDERVSLRSALVLTIDEDPREDGFFQVREIYGTPLDSDLAVLSACQTGKGKLETGEGVSGLSRAFLYAGTQAVLASLWNINDRATAAFMERFYGFLAQGKGKDEALRLAKKSMLDSAFRHPFYWSAFVVIGDARTKVDWPGR